MPSPMRNFTMPTPPSANALFRNLPKRGRVKTARYNDFIRQGITAIRAQKVKPLKGYVVMVIGVERMSGRADIDNRLKALLDTIVMAGVLEDDRFVTAIALSWLPKANGLSHISIFPVGSPLSEDESEKLSLTFHPSQQGDSGGWFQQQVATTQKMEK